MKTLHNLKSLLIIIMLCWSIVPLTSCKENEAPPGTISIDESLIDFGVVGTNAPSPAYELSMLGQEITKDVTAEVTGDFELAVGNEEFNTQVVISSEQANKGLRLKLRSKPTRVGEQQGTLTLSGHLERTITIDLLATGVEKLHVVSTFDGFRLAFGNGFSQSVDKTFTFPDFSESTEKITMYVKLRCPSGGCNAWDVFANVRLQHPQSGEWLEIGRYITPYGVDNSKVPKGFPIDVTDFKSLLTGEVTLKTYVEVWGNDGWLVSVNFEVIEGTPDYSYYAIAPVLDYAKNSLEGIPYGEAHDFDLEKCITIPAHAEETGFRTIITGWGHATPADPDQRRCAEWCFRTHHILIDSIPFFTHDMQGIGCSTNPVQPQGGNWEPDRAGWCPGMAVPVRWDQFDSSMAGESFCYTYDLEPWTNDMQTTVDNKHAYYAISSYIIVKSNIPIDEPVVE